MIVVAVGVAIGITIVTEKHTDANSNLGIEDLIAKYIIVPCFQTEKYHCINNKHDRESKIIDVKALIAYEADLIGISSIWALAIAEQESGFTCNVISKADAHGIMQVLYTTAKQMGYTDKKENLLRCSESIKYGIRYLKFVFDKANGDLCLASNKYFNGANSSYTDKGKAYCRQVLTRVKKYDKLRV